MSLGIIPNINVQTVIEETLADSPTKLDNTKRVRFSRMMSKSLNEEDFELLDKP